MTDEYEEKSGRKVKAVAATWLSTRRFLPQRTILRISLEPRGPKPQWEARPAGERWFELNHLKRGRWSQEWGHCKVEITPLKGGWNNPSYPFYFRPLIGQGVRTTVVGRAPSCSFEEVKKHPSHVAGQCLKVWEVECTHSLWSRHLEGGGIHCLEDHRK